MSDTLQAGIRERLGITDAGLDEQGLLAALDEALAEQADPTPVAQAPGTVLIDAGQFRSAARIARDRERRRDDADVVGLALRDLRRSLHKVAAPVQQVDDRIRQLVRDMAETMYAAPGVGLAATQVDVHERVVVIDVSEDGNDLHVLINPEITWKSEELQVYEEGCLSVPLVYDNVPRATQVTVQALDGNGKPFTLEADGLLAVCLQHELDHLEGKVFVEYLSPLKQNRIRTKLKKLEKRTM